MCAKVRVCSDNHLGDHLTSYSVVTYMCILWFLVVIAGVELNSKTLKLKNDPETCRALEYPTGGGCGLSLLCL